MRSDDGRDPCEDGACQGELARQRPGEMRVEDVRAPTPEETGERDEPACSERPLGHVGNSNGRDARSSSGFDERSDPP
jgi:hypothetical protein